MAEGNAKKRIFISACEPSADMHCANLIHAAERRGLGGQIEWVGVGGEQMARAGCRVLEDTVSRASMIYNALGQAGFYWKIARRIGDYLRSNKVDLVIVCDSPAFNFHVARAARAAGIKVLFYIAPQLWAWAPWRIRKLRRCCDKLACILPFEEDWFCSRNVDARFVGNPLFDDVSIDFTNRRKDYSNYEPRKATIALMPGSRIAEVRSLWPAMQKVAIQILQKWPQSTFIAVAPSEGKMQLLRSRKLSGFKCEFTVGNAIETANRADIALVASGSATLQVAAVGCPMVIMYQSSRLLWHLAGRWLIRTRFLSLVNILAGREMVNEFMPYFKSIRPIVDCCNTLIGNKILLTKISADLEGLVAPLTVGWASDEVAQMAWEMIEDADREQGDRMLESRLG